MRVQKQDLRDRVSERNCLVPATETYCMLGMHRTRTIGTRLSGIDRNASGIHKPGKHAFAGNERVLVAEGFMCRRCKHRRSPLTYLIEVERTGAEHVVRA